MTVVVDASVLVSALAGDPRRGAPAREHLRRGAPLHAPHLLDAEVASGLSGLAGGGKLAPADARAALDRYARTRLTRHPHRGLMNRLWELRADLTPYDALYVALAEALDVPLLTEDARIAEAPGLRCAVRVLAT